MLNYHRVFKHIKSPKDDEIPMKSLIQRLQAAFWRRPSGWH